MNLEFLILNLEGDFVKRDAEVERLQRLLFDAKLQSHSLKATRVKVRVRVRVEVRTPELRQT